MSEVVAKARLKSFVERIEHLDEEAKATREDLKEVYAEAKGEGFNVKALRAVVRARAQDQSVREELEQIIELYRSAVGV